MLRARRVAVVGLLTALLVLASGPWPDLDPLPECLFGCRTVFLGG